jgi:hypothetical protein
VPLSVGRLPLLPVAAIASILLLLAFFEWEIYFGGAIGIALTAVAFLLQRWWARTRK